MKIPIFLSKLSSIEKAKFKPWTISGFLANKETPKYLQHFNNVIDFSNVVPRQLVKKTILPGEQLSYSQAKNRYISAQKQIKDSLEDFVDTSKYLSKGTLKRIEWNKELLKKYYKSQYWADRARESGLSDNEVAATSKLLCDNVDRTVIIANPLKNEKEHGMSLGGSGGSFPNPIVAYQSNPRSIDIMHELLHASEFNSTAYLENFGYINPNYYKGIDRDAVNGLRKMSEFNEELSMVAEAGLHPKLRRLSSEEYARASKEGKQFSDFGEYITNRTELRSHRMAKKILNLMYDNKFKDANDFSKYFSPEVNKYIDDRIYATIPAIGIAGKSVYDMLGNQNNQSNDQNIQY